MFILSSWRCSFSTGRIAINKVGSQTRSKVSHTLLPCCQLCLSRSSKGMFKSLPPVPFLGEHHGEPTLIFLIASLEAYEANVSFFLNLKHFFDLNPDHWVWYVCWPDLIPVPSQLQVIYVLDMLTATLSSMPFPLAAHFYLVRCQCLSSLKVCFRDSLYSIPSNYMLTTIFALLTGDYISRHDYNLFLNHDPCSDIHLDLLRGDLGWPFSTSGMNEQITSGMALR